MEDYYDINHKIDELWDRREKNSHSPTTVRRINEEISELSVKIIDMWSSKYVSPKHRDEFFSLMLPRLASLVPKTKGTHPGAINCFSKVLSTAMKMCYRRVLERANNPHSSHNYIEMSNLDQDPDESWRANRSSECDPDFFPIEERLIARQVMDKVPSGIYKFSPREQEVFDSVFSNDFISLEQTGRDMGISGGSVGKMVSRIAEKIKKVEGL